MVAPADGLPAATATATATPGPRNLPRASLACERCRAKKAKCDQRRPCSRCVHVGHEARCSYAVSRRGQRARKLRHHQQADATHPAVEDEVADSAPSIDHLNIDHPSIDHLSIDHPADGSLQGISDGDEIGDVNVRTHGVEFYGTSSNHVLLSQLFSFVRNNRRHGQLRREPIYPLAASGSTELVSHHQDHLSAERPSVVNLLSIEDPLLPPSPHGTPPPTLRASSRRVDLTRGPQAAGVCTNPSSPLDSSTLVGHSRPELISQAQPPGQASPLPSRPTADRSRSQTGGHDTPINASRRRLERELVRSYLHNLHYLHPMIDSTEFVARCEAEVWLPGARAKKPSQRRHFSALFNIVVAVGALVAGQQLPEEFSQELIALEQSKQRGSNFSQQDALRALSRSYFLEARTSLGDVFEVCSLESAQTLLLMVNCAP